MNSDTTTQNSIFTILALAVLGLAGCGDAQNSLSIDFGDEAPEMTTQLLDDARRTHLQYWRFEKAELRELESRDDLSWQERLRLLHHYQSRMLSSPAGSQQIGNTDPFEAKPAPPGPLHDKAVAMMKSLVSSDSPYRPRSASIWQEKSKNGSHESPDLEGMLQNLSATHLGSLEVIRLDTNNQPLAVEFIPFSSLKAIQFDAAAEYRPVRLHYQDQREPEIVLTPYFYWLSYYSMHASDKDGSSTRFILHLGDPANAGLGIGEQDFTVGTAIFRLSTIRLIQFE